MPRETVNISGRDVTRQNEGQAGGGATSNITDSNTTTGDREAQEAQDDQNLKESQNNIQKGNFSEAQDNINNIEDDQKRANAQSELNLIIGDRDIDMLGTSDPLSLFFLMVFYLDKFTPSFSWSDVLDNASQLGGGDVRPIPISVIGDTAAREKTADQLAEARAGLNQDRGEAEDTLNESQSEAGGQLNGGAQQSSDQGSGLAETLVWPFQNMPIIESGISKSVDWPTLNQTTTMAEPMIARNKGGGPIELNVRFEYAVGLGSIPSDSDAGLAISGDAPGGEISANIGVDNDPWTVAEIMGVIYLAESLVYPFESIPILGSNDRESLEGYQSNENAEGAQFPLLFMRHYSLFPFITPFLCKQVTITPDENQPLIIGNNSLLTAQDTHLAIAACRQIVRIELSLISAHYYLPVFANQGMADAADQIRQMTSGKTYLNLARGMLLNRFNNQERNIQNAPAPNNSRARQGTRNGFIKPNATIQGGNRTGDANATIVGLGG